LKQALHFVKTSTGEQRIPTGIVTQCLLRFAKTSLAFWQKHREESASISY